MAEKPITFVEVRRPTQCVLWAHPEHLVDRFKEHLEHVETYEDSSHLERSMFRCRECGQLYFFEWNEWVDWEDGDDKQYTTLVPVQTEAEIEAIKKTDMLMLMTYTPRLHLDGGRAVWVGGD